MERDTLELLVSGARLGMTALEFMDYLQDAESLTARTELAAAVEAASKTLLNGGGE
jgi:hypothetical protein